MHRPLPADSRLRDEIKSRKLLFQRLPKRVSGDANGVHTPERNKNLKPILRDTRPNKPSEPRSAEARFTIEDKSNNYRMVKKEKDSLWTTRKTNLSATNSINSTVVKRPVIITNDVIVFWQKEHENVLKSYRVYHNPNH